LEENHSISLFLTSIEALKPEVISLFEEGISNDKSFDKIKFFLRAIATIVEKHYNTTTISTSTPVTTSSTTTSTTTTTTTTATTTTGKGKKPNNTNANNNNNSNSTSSGVKESVEKLSKTLFLLLTKTKTKTIAKVENTLIYFILFHFSKSNKAIEQQAEKEGIWTYFFSNNSFLFTEGYCERLDIYAFPFLYELLNNLLLNYTQFKQLQASR
jgi:hypothetical protein